MKRPPKTKAATHKAAVRRANRLRALEDRMLAIEATIKRQDRHFGRMLAPVVNVAADVKLIRQQLEEQKRRSDLLYKGVDSLLKAFSPESGGMAAIEAEDSK